MSQKNKTIGIIVAMQSELNLISQALENSSQKEVNGFAFIEGNIAGHHIILAQSGIGKVFSSIKAVEMINTFHPDYIINTGIAGGIDIKTQVMDIIIGQEITYHDVWCGEGNCYGQVQGLPARFHSDETLCKAALAIETPLNIYCGLICSGDKFITARDELDTIKKQFPEGLAVDMESCSIAQVCYLYNTPYLSLRIISDTPGIKDHIKQYENFWQQAPEKSLEILRKLIAKI